jgi:voltage-gated potassium channel
LPNILIFLTILKLGRVLYVVWRDIGSRHILILVLGLLLTGTIFYSNIEGGSVFDSLYLSVVTLATVGYGDPSPKTTFGKAFTIIYILVGIGLFVAVAQAFATGIIHRKGKGHTKSKSDHD